MTRVVLAATQFAMVESEQDNIAKAEQMVRRAARQGAQIILLPELFSLPYFCKDQEPHWFARAKPQAGNALLDHFSRLAAELQVVLPVSYFEVANNAYYNSIGIIDATGDVLGNYRKSHIPDGPGYQEKYYFRPGDTGPRVWRTRYGCLGVGICWDQWFPELARAMALMGAEVLLYPTAIGSEPQDATLDSRDHWQRVMQGHAGANLMPLVASNRIGREQGRSCATTFYGSSFIAGATGEKIVEAGRDEEAVVTAEMDLEKIRRQRDSWGVFRDRRPELYATLGSADGAPRGSF